MDLRQSRTEAQRSLRTACGRGEPGPSCTATAPSRPVQASRMPRARSRSRTSRCGVPKGEKRGPDAMARLGATASRKRAPLEVRLP